ncbi:MAG: hypothetical protein COB17_03415 [Sulfurimonas sp.]|nr:MAG: hypothetical protein COB17_03415 [Sulfurimonas sp.]
MKINIPIIILILFSFLNADKNIDNLLNDIENKSDLSNKTKLTNSVISQIYTRNDIQRMQIRYLKDILKTSYLSEYNENRYGVADPFSIGLEILAFRSSSIRIYIDNQEISSGLYGSSLMTYGDLDISYADHIEVYYQNPNYEYSTESNLVLIKIYSKSTLKDEGAKVELNTGSYGASRISAYLAQDLDNDWSHFTYISLNNDKRKKYNSFNQKLSKDKKVAHLFSSIKNKNQTILIDISQQQRDAFMGLSLDATPTEAIIDFKNIHIGYDNSNNNFSFLFSYDYEYINSLFIDDVKALLTSPYNVTYPISKLRVKLESQVFTSELKYSFITSNNKLTVGIKYRQKAYSKSDFDINNISISSSKNNYQTVLTMFLENEYSLGDNKIINVGLQVSEINNNHSSQDNKLLMYRLGYTYLINKWTYKTIFSHIERALDPYLVDEYGIYLTSGIKKTQKYRYITENIGYEKENNLYSFLIAYIKLKDILIPSINSPLLDNSDKDINVYSTYFRWTHKYNKYDKLFATLNYYSQSGINGYKTTKKYMATLRNINTYKKLDLFFELIYFRDNIQYTNFYDLSLGIKYKYKENLTFSIKGENLLKKASATIFTRIDSTTLQNLKPLLVSPIDKKIILSIEYQF